MSDLSTREGGAETTWYSDADQLLEELRRGGPATEAVPIIAGYDDFVLLGRGGQGIVFAATQLSTRRRVAVKVLLDGAFASRAARRRFEREVELVATLEHPGIVRIFDSGTMEDGRLYTVMALIEGEPLDRWMAARPLSAARDRHAWLRERIDLAAAIGDAVHHAHQRGVIHRDLKPGNVRVDSKGRPHVLDFGLAKSLGERPSDERRAMSVSGVFMGSIPWASPEQAEGALNQIDVRSDVYSLGVITYQLTTEALPYDTSGPMGESLRVVSTQAPTPPRSLNGDIDIDLETILLKALAKDPLRRYQSVGDFAADLRRAARGEAIDARRDSAWYVLRMAAKRNRWALSAAALIATILLVGAAATTWQWRIAESQRVRADRRFDEVRGLARTVMFEVHDAIAELPGSRPARELLATTAMAYLQSLAEESADEPELLVEIADGHLRIGDLLGNPYTANLGNTAGAISEYERGLELLEPLLASRQEPGVRRLAASLQNRIGDVRSMAGDRVAAIEHHERALALLDASSAMPTKSEIDRVERMSSTDSKELDRVDRRLIAATNLKIGDALVWTQDRSAALARFEQALASFESLLQEPDPDERDRFSLQICCSKIGFALGSMDRVEEALARQEQALEISQSLAALEPNNAIRRRSVSINHNQVGAMLVRLERADEALEHFEAALRIAEAQVAEDPDDRLAQADLAYTLNKVGEAHWQHAPEQAIERFMSALRIRASLANAAPANGSVQRDHAVSMIKVGDALLRLAQGPQRSDRAWAARSHFQGAETVLAAMRDKGTLAEVDGHLVEQARAGISQCDAMLQEAVVTPTGG